MLSQQDNELLTRTGPGTSMGALFRSFWMPVLLSQEIAEPDCPPVRVKVMGEDLVAFRDTQGRVGLVDPVCPHRGANLFFGRNEDCGIRCAYHGWKFDVEGRCIDMPSAPANTSYRDKIRLKVYPARDWSGFVWAYMGPLKTGAELPPLPLMEFALVPPEHRFVGKKLQQCNWAQACEGGLDTAHFSFLHMDTATDAAQLMRAMRNAEAGAQGDRVRWLKNDGVPRFTVTPHAAGLLLGAARNADGDDLYWRISQFLMPCHGLAPNAFPGENYHGQSWVPIDDRHCWVYCYSWNPDRPLTAAEREKFGAGFSIYSKVDSDWKPLANRGNDYLVDRDAQRRGSFTGVSGVSEQDACIQDSQGFIADRTREHLGPTDLGIVRFRRLVLQAAKELAERGTAPAALGHPQAYAMRSGGTVAPGDRDLAQVMVERFGHPQGWVGGHHGLAEDPAALSSA
jgi:phthalate 4,5-dioxygenase oxygenase subunit